MGQTQIIAANIDYGLIVQSVNRDFNINRLERYLTICNASKIEPIIVLSKVDLIEKQELTVWINQNKAHHKILLDMASYWDDLSVLNELSGLFPLEKSYQKPSNKLYVFAIAASLAIFSFLGASVLQTNSFFPFNEQHLVQTQTFKTKVGEQASFSMSDGSSIQLNTNSIVTVDFTPLQHTPQLTNR